MEREQQWIMLWIALVPLFITHHANSELLHKPVDREITNDNNPDFISIDCGSPVDYLDVKTGIWYQTDKGFVESGKNQVISPNISSDLDYDYIGKQFKTLRSFPEGNRNCYTLKPKQGKNNRYLIRAFFAYGNYDNQNQNPSFDVYIGVNYVDTIGIFKMYYQYTEIIHTPSTDTIHVCLVRTGPTIPYISTLELRLLNSSIYPIMSNSSTPQPLLNVEARVDVGSFQNPLHRRYKDDVYDRIWRRDPNNDTNGWNPLNESVVIDPAANIDAYKLPSQVLSTAAKSLNVSEPLEFDYTSVFKDLNGNFDYHVYLHFAEIEALPKGKKRIINNITLNSKNVLSKPLVLEYLKPVTIGPLPVSQGNVQFSIRSTSESDAPPILNALEIYQLMTKLDSPTNIQDVSAILDIKSVYKISRLNWQGDPCLPSLYVWEGLVCSSDTNPRITSLNLSSSKLTGEISTEFSYLTELESLDLSDNYLVGPVPEFLAELPKLKILNLTRNKLSGTIPKALKEKADTTLQLSVTDNPDLCVTNSCEKKNFVTPLVASLSAFIAVLLISLGIWMFTRRKVTRSNPKKGESSLKTKNQAFSYTEINNITDNFKTVIGKGGFGEVYLGNLQDHTQVAVKLLSPSSVQGYKEFRSEAQLLMIVHHRNLVSLIGYCDEGHTKALVYEYMPNGNLQQHLSVKNPNVLKWIERLHIAVDAAHGLDYLHNGCKPALVHRDLKPSNILLDQNMHAKIGDFGLCRAFGNDIDSHISTCPAGTPGYVDPEFQRTGNSNKKSDIFSFGIILFELITGQPSLARDNEKIIHILEWVIPTIERGDIRNLVDSRLQQEEFNMNSAWKAVEIALSCISSSAAERPDISQILAELKECVSMEMVQRHMGRGRSTAEYSSLLMESDLYPSPR